MLAPLATTLLSTTLLPLSTPQDPAATTPAQRVAVKVLYAGVPDAARTAQWRAFLQPRTAAFEVVDVTEFTPAAATGFDVVVLDCPDPIRRDDGGRAQRIAVPQPAQLTAAFDRPTIVVGGMALVTDRLDLKSNWL